MTEKIIVVILVLACLICVFCIFYLVLDIIVTIKENKKETKVKPTLEKIKEPEIKKEESVIIESNDGMVTFTQNKKELFREKYLNLDTIHRTYCDDIEKKALLVKNARKRESNNHIDIKVGKLSIVRMLIKRDILTCEFYFQSFEFKTYSRQNKIKCKIAPIVIKVIEEDDYQAVIKTIDVAEKAIEEEKIYRKKLKKEQKEVNKAQV